MKTFEYNLFLFSLFFVTVILNNVLQKHVVHSAEVSNHLYMPSSFYLSFKSVTADYCWLQLLLCEKPNTDYIWHVSNFITDLDPHFSIIYRYSSVILARMGKLDAAQALLKKSLDSPVCRHDKKVVTLLEYVELLNC